jgi:cytochrome bd-type quinol oxidase subunit 2
MPRFKYKLSVLLSSMTFVSMLILAPVSVFAAGPCGTKDNSSQSQILGGIGETTNTNATDCSGSQVQSTVKTVINIMSYFVGVVSVIMVVVGGFQFITSSGDSGKVATARNTIVYALIGLFIVALAQVIVHFVLQAAINNTVSSG